MFNKMLKIFQKKFLIVYQKENGEVKTYEISQPRLKDSIGNKQEGRNNVGFKAYCFARKQVRSFRHDRLISITKL